MGGTIISNPERDFPTLESSEPRIKVHFMPGASSLPQTSMVLLPSVPSKPSACSSAAGTRFGGPEQVDRVAESQTVNGPAVTHHFGTSEQVRSGLGHQLLAQ